MIQRACVKCGRITTGRYCDEHQPESWDDQGQRRQRTTNGWAQQRRARAILTQDDTCHVCNLPGADQVDHVIPLAHGGTDTRDNLKPIHSRPCHQNKTQAEARQQRTK